MMKSFLPLVCLFALGVGCSDEVECVASYKDKGGPEVPCVATSSASGGANSCFTPAQICPNIAPITFCTRTGGSSNPVNLTLENRGELPMKITGVKVRGDTRCAFKRAQFSPVIGETIEPGRSMVIRFFYEAPAGAGEDHALVEITSDAENYPTLAIPVCGKSGASEAMCLVCNQDRTAAEYTDCFDKP